MSMTFSLIYVDIYFISVGKIVSTYAKVYGKKTLYEEMVSDVLMGVEEYYLREYGKDISNLEVLVTQFEDIIAFEKEEHGNMILKLIQVHNVR